MSDEIPQHLPRGRACVPCRKRKMKCDGNQPICNQCLRFNRANECEFKEGPAPSTTRVLEQHIARLESRIAELETDDPNAVRLHDPYSQSRPAASSTHPSPAIQPAQINWWDMPEPPTAMQQLLVQSFLRQAFKIGFFFDPQRFFNGMESTTGARPPTVIRNAVYLWGITLSHNPQYIQHESKYLGRALRSLQVALSACSIPQQQGGQEGNALDVLQASVLLANYFFHHNRLLEGKFHASAATSLAHMCNLHKLLSPTGPGGTSVIEYLPRPVDVTQECERIHAWWAVYILDKTWVVALRAPSTINEEQERGLVVDTPWPISKDLYRQHPSSSRANHGSTTKRFLAETLNDNSNSANSDPSCLALLAKAATLYERANYVASYLEKNTPTYPSAISTLDASIERFKQSLPAIERSAQLSPDTAHTLLLIHCLTHSATIQLHWPLTSRSSTSINRCMVAATTIGRVVQALDVKQMEFINPVIGVLASTAGEVLAQGIRSLRSSRTASASSSSASGEERFMLALSQLSNSLSGAAAAPFIEYQSGKIREVLATL